MNILNDVDPCDCCRNLDQCIDIENSMEYCQMIHEFDIDPLWFIFKPMVFQ